MNDPCSTGDYLEDPGVAAQAVFDAGWDLRTRWHRGERVRAAEYPRWLPQDLPVLPEVLYELAQAERVACREAGESEPVDVGWLREPLSGRAEVYAQLLQLLGSAAPSGLDLPTRYSYLSEPQSPGELGRLGGYRVIREIDRGGMGAVVFEVELENTLLEPRRALKVLKAGLGPSAARERFIREARAAFAIQHPNVVRASAAAAGNEVVWIEMEYVYGPTLHALVQHHRGEPTPLRLAADLVRQTALGLAAAHDLDKPLTHRDIKPGNILLERVPVNLTYRHGWRVRVCDFGLARAAEDAQLTRPGFAMGTPEYMSPEQLTQRVSSPASDVFALGVVAYKLVTGLHPFVGDTDGETIALIRVCNVPSPRDVNLDVPERLADLILRMLKHSPADRPLASQVVNELSELLRSDEWGTAGQPQGRERNGDAGRLTAAQTTQQARHPGGERAETLPPTEPTPAIMPLGLRCDVSVWKGGVQGPGLPIDDPEALPLRAGDHIRLEVRLHRPAYLYVLQLEASGDVAPLHPWEECDWTRRGADEPDVKLSLPRKPSAAVPLTAGPAGLEAFVVLAREEPLPAGDNERLKSLFTGARQGTVDLYHGVTWVGGNEEADPDADRGRVDLNAAKPVEDPIARLRRLLRSDEILKLSSDRRCVCYPFAGS